MNTNLSAHSQNRLKILLHTAFFLSGTATVLIGQVLPLLARRFSLSDAESGYYFLSQFSGSLLGTFAERFSAKKFGFKTSAVIGLAAMAIGILGLNSNSNLFCVIAFFVNGIGIGITLPAINMQIVELNRQNITPALNLLNFFWGLGAIICKPFTDFTAAATNIVLTTFILALLFIVNTAAIIFMKDAKSFVKTDDSDKITIKPPVWTTGTAWLFALFGFLHVGFESAMGGWLTTYSSRFAESDLTALYISPTFCYYLFFVVGRGIAPFLASKISDESLIFICLTVILLGVSILIFADSFAFLIAGASIAGIGTSAVFPTIISKFTKTFGETATARATPIFVAGTVGSMSATSLIGFISTNYGNLRIGMSVLQGICVLLPLIWAGLYFASKKKSDILS